MVNPALTKQYKNFQGQQQFGILCIQKVEGTILVIFIFLISQRFLNTTYRCVDKMLLLLSLKPTVHICSLNFIGSASTHRFS